MFYLWYDGLGFGHPDSCASAHESLGEAIEAAQHGYQSVQVIRDDVGRIVWTNDRDIIVPDWPEFEPGTHRYAVASGGGDTVDVICVPVNEWLAADLAEARESTPGGLTMADQINSLLVYTFVEDDGMVWEETLAEFDFDSWEWS